MKKALCAISAAVLCAALTVATAVAATDSARAARYTNEVYFNKTVSTAGYTDLVGVAKLNNTPYAQITMEYDGGISTDCRIRLEKNGVVSYTSDQYFKVGSYSQREYYVAGATAGNRVTAMGFGYYGRRQGSLLAN